MSISHEQKGRGNDDQQDGDAESWAEEEVTRKELRRLKE